jgi:hypothetical protein
MAFAIASHGKPPVSIFPTKQRMENPKRMSPRFFVAIPGADTYPPKHVMEEMREEGIREIVTPGGRCCRVATASACGGREFCG